MDCEAVAGIFRNEKQTLSNCKFSRSRSLALQATGRYKVLYSFAETEFSLAQAP
jgi:hypothetical protein